MSRLLSLTLIVAGIIFLTAIAAEAQMPISVVDTKSCGGMNCTVTLNTSAQTTAILCGVVSTTGSTPGLSDSQFNTYTQTGFASTAQPVLRVFRSIGGNYSGGSITVQVNGGNFPAAVCLTLANVDSFAQNTGSPYTGIATASLQPGSITPANPNTGFFTFMASNSGAIPTIASGFGPVTYVPTAGASNWGIASSFLIQTTPMAVNPTWMLSAASDMGAAMVALNPIVQPQAPTFVDVRSAGHSAATMNTQISGLNASGASAIVCGTTVGDTGPTPVPTDSQANTYTQLTVTASSGTMRTAVFLSVGGSYSNAMTVTLPYEYHSGVCYAFSGVASFDKAAPGFAGANAANTVRPGAITPTNANAVVVTFASINNFAGSPNITPASFVQPSAGTSWIDTVAGGFFGTLGSFSFQTTPAVTDPLWAIGPLPTQVTAAMVALNAASTAPIQVFTQQPTQTENGFVFQPAVAIAAPSRAGAMFTMSLDAPCGTVALTGSTTVTLTGTGTGIWTGMGVTGTGMGCHLRSTDMGGMVANAVSTAFDVLPQAGLIVRTDVASCGGYFGCTATLNNAQGSSAVICAVAAVTQPGVPSDTYNSYSSLPPSPGLSGAPFVYMFTSVGGVYPSTLNITTSGSVTGMVCQSFSGVGSFGMQSAGGTGTGSVQPGALTGSAFATFMGSNLGSSLYPSALPTINQGFSILHEGTSNRSAVDFGNWGVAGSYLSHASPASMNPTWTGPSVVPMTATMVLLIPGTPPPPAPIQVFSVQPIVPGGVMIDGRAFEPPVQIQTLNPRAGVHFTLSLDMACGNVALTGTPTVATDAMGRATWSGVGVTGTGAFCRLKSTDTSGMAPPITSDYFDVVPPPPLVLNTGFRRDFVGHGNGATCPAGRICHYVDQVNGNDNNNGLARTTGGGNGPWKNAPGMNIETPGSVVANYSYTPQDMLIMKGGNVWTLSSAGLGPTGSAWYIVTGTTSTPNPTGYPGLYIGYDPGWNIGQVLSLQIIDPGDCSPNAQLSITLTGGGGSGATATATMIRPDTDFNFYPTSWGGVYNPDMSPRGYSLLWKAVVNTAGSGYTSDPTVNFTVTTGSCGKLPEVYADIHSPIISGGTAVWGSKNGIPHALQMPYVDYATLDHLEFRSFLRYSSNDFTEEASLPSFMVGVWGYGSTVQNNYFHGWDFYNFHEWLEACWGPQGTGFICAPFMFNPGAMIQFTGEEHVNNNVITQGDSSQNLECSQYGDAYLAHYCVYGFGVYDPGYYTNNAQSWILNQLYATRCTAQLHWGCLIAGNKMWGCMHDVAGDHGNCYYTFTGMTFYNNILMHVNMGQASGYFTYGTPQGGPHDFGYGAIGFHHVVFNNVYFDQGTSTNGFVLTTTDSGCNDEYFIRTHPIVEFYNNTGVGYAVAGALLGVGGWNAPTCFSYPGGPGYNFNSGPALLNQQFEWDLYNNHAISNNTYPSPGFGYWFDANSEGNPNLLATMGPGKWNGLTSPESTATRMAVTAANINHDFPASVGEGFLTVNRLAPANASASTVTFHGTNLTSRCNATNDGNDLRPLCFDILGNPRPATGPWQGGPYQFLDVGPVLAFGVPGPQTTVSGTAMASFTVVLVNGAPGTNGMVTLMPNTCGASFANLTATMTNHTATFSNVIPTGTAQNCHFTASLPGAANATSANFNVNAPPPPPTLAFTVQPSTTAPGKIIGMATGEFVTVTHSLPAFNGTVTLAITTPGVTGCTGSTLASLTAGTTATFSNGVATFLMLTPSSATTTGSSNCTLTATSSDSLTATSGPFDVRRIITFDVEPSTTVTGQTMTPPVRILMNDAAIAIGVSLSLVDCPGSSISGNIANWSNGQATFPNLVVTGVNTGCRLSASNTVGFPGVSEPFSIVNVAGPTLVFTNQPHDIVNGGGFTPPIAGIKTNAP